MKEYQSPVTDVIVIAASQIICTSGETTEGYTINDGGAINENDWK